MNGYDFDTDYLRNGSKHPVVGAEDPVNWVGKTAKKFILVGIGLMVLYVSLVVGGILAVAYGLKVIFAG